MASITEHGTIWKDTEDGIWTGFVAVFGIKMLAHAIEITVKDGKQCAVTTEGENFLANLPHGIFGYKMDTVRIGDMTCAIVIVS